jgi:hypothetical protein
MNSIRMNYDLPQNRSKRAGRTTLNVQLILLANRAFLSMHMYRLLAHGGLSTPNAPSQRTREYMIRARARSDQRVQVQHFVAQVNEEESHPQVGRDRREVSPSDHTIGRVNPLHQFPMFRFPNEKIGECNYVPWPPSTGSGHQSEGGSRLQGERDPAQAHRRRPSEGMGDNGEFTGPPSRR